MFEKCAWHSSLSNENFEFTRSQGYLTPIGPYLLTPTKVVFIPCPLSNKAVQVDHFHGSTKVYTPNTGGSYVVCIEISSF